LLPSAVKKVWGKEGRLVTVAKEKHTTCNTSLEVCTLLQDQSYIPGVLLNITCTLIAGIYKKSNSFYFHDICWWLGVKTEVCLFWTVVVAF